MRLLFEIEAAGDESKGQCLDGRKMTDTERIELRKLLGEKVMGWDSSHVYQGDQKLEDWFKPDLSIEQAFMVRDKICESLFSERQRFKRCLQESISNRVKLLMHMDEVVLYMTAEDICLAARAWVRNKETQ